MENLDNLSLQWLCRRAELLSENGYVHRGLVYQLVAYHMQPDDENVLHGLARIFAAAGDGARALDVVGKLEAMGVDAADLSMARANAFLAMGNTEETAKILAQHLDTLGKIE